ncbi:hypothetical protein FFI97_020380 [Variovorax sp. KBS0712]|uniref:TadG family pilus assembly protein n=1 Tax=Variovorax sp. KBS0712 TaxID=2578111 RepID=UPI00111960BE|nr:TadG family pilus assembly protein [Variovorax sp. KBS0712]TSD56573.1 hypothetical protein FFI97_020380 [Variovorax sp. KBS0712]
MTAVFTRPVASSSFQRRGRGSILINTAIAMSLIVITLIGVELGYLFFVKREIQKATDLAALAGAQMISSADGCTDAKTAAKLSANGTGATDTKRNLPPVFSLVDEDIECGRWSPDKATVDHFEIATTELNAVRVTIKRTPISLLPFFEADRTIQSKAVAANDPIASFSLGTGLASLNEGVANQLLNALLGTGNKISLKLVDYQGLAKAQVRLLDLISAIPNVGTVDELLNTPIKLNDLMLAMVQALGNSNALAVQALNSIISANVKSVEIKLGDLLKVTTPSREGAANAAINVLDLLTTTAQIANGKNLVKLGSTIDLGALAKADVQLVVIEPPSIAIGPAGKDANGNWRTQAHSAAVRLLLDVKLVDTNEIPGLSWLVKVTLLRLPIYLEVAQGHGRLSSIKCASTLADCRVDIEAKPGLASICIAGVSDALMSNTTTPINCSAMPPTMISEISALGIPVLQVYAKVPVQAETPDTSYQKLTFNGVIGDTDDVQTVNSNAVGSVLSNTLSNFTDGTKWTLTTVLLGALPLPLGGILSPLLSFVLSILSPLFGLLDAIIVPLLNLLGVQLGYSDVRFLSLLCGESKLVY